MNGCNFYCQPVTNTNTTVTPYIDPTCSSIKNNTVTIIAKGDSAATKNYWREEDINVLSDITHFSGPAVMIPNGESIQATKQGILPLSPFLSLAAKQTSILPQLKSSSLISLGQLADDGCTIVLDYKKLTAIKERRIVLEGIRNTKDGLWDIPVHKHLITQDNISFPKTHPGLYASRTNKVLAPKANIIKQKIQISPIIKKLPFQHLDRIIAEQLKYDKLNSSIAPHLRNLDELCYDNSNQPYKRKSPYYADKC